MTCYRHSIRALVILLVSLLTAGSSPAAEPPDKPSSSKTESPPRSLRGKVVWLSEALERRHNIKEVPEAAERVLALETPQGDLHPLVEDVRGRAFRRDPRFRNLDMELVVRQHPGVPFVQVIRVFEIRHDGKYELDYWCDVCSIAMFELKECECCQGPIELRARKVAE